MPETTTPSELATHLAPIQKRRRGRPRDPEADGRILSAATELMLLGGYERMTVDEVAARAGVGKATVYRRWAKKEDLAVAAAEALYRESMPVASTGDLEADLRSNYRDTLEFAGSPEGGRYLRTAVGESMRDTRIAALYANAYDRTADSSVEMLAEAQQRGEIRPEINLELVNRVIAGLVLLNTISDENRTTVTDLEDLLEVLLHGIMPTTEPEPAADRAADHGTVD